MLFQNMSLSLKEGQFSLVRAVGRTEKGGYTMEEVLSLSVDDLISKSPCFKSQKVSFALACH